MEVLYRVWTDEDERAGRLAYEQLKALPLLWIEASEPLLELAASSRARDALSVADAWIAAAAQQVGATLLHKESRVSSHGRSVPGMALLIQQLDRYRTPPHWHPGAPWLVRTLWFCLGAPLLSARWLPGSVWRVALLRVFGARIGPGCRLKPGLRVKFPWRLQLGQACWLAEDAWLDNLAPITLGDRVCISQGAYLCTGNHDFRSPGFDLRLGPITIGSDAWIAARAVLAPGTQIGPGAVVALAAVVNSTVPAGAIVRGNPAVVVGQR